MKIGILTFHRAHNYGAVLQAFALQECLKSLGHDVYFIDYNNEMIVGVYENFSLKRIWSRHPAKLFLKTFNEFKYYNSRKLRWFNFEEFISKKLTINPSIEKSYLNKYYDAIFVGSDQVWNFKLTNGFDYYYWGDFSNKNNKLISYAASMEASSLTNYESTQVAKGLGNFDYISVREDSLKDYIQDLTSQPISVVADPTLIVNTETWNKIAIKPKIRKPYLLLYQVRNDKRNLDLATKIAKEMNLEVICLSARVDTINSSICVGASPEEYLGLFKYASFIVCSSFHGAVFSLLFNVPFYSILLDDGKDSRNLSLLNKVNLLHRAVRPDELTTFSTIIDWKEVNNKIKQYRLESIEFIQNSINN